MKLQRVYIDTSVIGGCFDSEFAQWSNQLMVDFEQARLKPVVSESISRSGTNRSRFFLHARSAPMKKNEFKCMQWIRTVREKHAAELKGKNAQERIAFYRQKAQLLQSRLAHEKVLA